MPREQTLEAGPEAGAGSVPPGPVGLNHIVLNVRDLDRAHAFWTDVLGFRQVAESDPSRARRMRFYAGRGGNHHDVALMQLPDGAAEAEAEAASRGPGLNHLAVEYGDQASWLAQLRRLQAAGVEFGSRVNHGTSHSVYIEDPDGHGVELLYSLPAEQWQGDVDAALNHLEVLPRDGEAALADPETPRFG